MVSQAEPETMPILATGSKSVVVSERIRLKDALMRSSFNIRKATDAGFTLIEMMVVVAIMAIVLGMAVLAIPNHDERYWKDNLNQLVSSLNLAQEESAMSGTPIIAQIDSVGWRFFIPNINGSAATNAPLGQPLSGNSSNTLLGNASTMMPEVYRPQSWYKPVEIAPLQLTLGGEQVTQVLQISLRQVTGSGAQLNPSDTRQAVLIRNRNGRFSWVQQ
jgi:type II secretion system protein H